MTIKTENGTGSDFRQDHARRGKEVKHENSFQEQLGLILFYFF